MALARLSPVENTKQSVVDTPATSSRCGRCAWWTGNRLRNSINTTVAFTIYGQCSNLEAPVEFSGRQVHYLSGTGCPKFKNWKDL
jgi:hypothetical protein